MPPPQACLITHYKYPVIYSPDATAYTQIPTMLKYVKAMHPSFFKVSPSIRRQRWYAFPLLVALLIRACSDRLPTED